MDFIVNYILLKDIDCRRVVRSLRYSVGCWKNHCFYVGCFRSVVLRIAPNSTRRERESIPLWMDSATAVGCDRDGEGGLHGFSGTTDRDAVQLRFVKMFGPLLNTAEKLCLYTNFVPGSSAKTIRFLETLVLFPF
jgi:hypothetical protein